MKDKVLVNMKIPKREEKIIVENSIEYPKIFREEKIEKPKTFLKLGL